VSKKPNSYEALRKIWYKKLSKSGFNDIEMPDGRFKGLSTEFTRDRAVYQYGGLEAKAEYHRLASWLLHEHEFESTIEHVIWEYHVNGLSIRDITQTLKKAKIKKTNRDFVHKVLQKLKQIMLDKYVNK